MKIFKKHEVSNFTIENETGRLLLLYQTKEDRWVLPKKSHYSKKYAIKNLLRLIQNATGYQIKVLSVENNKNKYDIPLVTQIVSNVPVFHQQKFNWFYISEMVEKNVDVNIIIKARLLGCF